MYGRICDEQILLNHEAIWHQPSNPIVADISDFVDEYRAMIRGGKYREAVGYLHKKNEERGGKWHSTDPYEPACDVRITTATTGPFTAYRRGIDFAGGTAWTRWRDDTGNFERQVFVSRADGIVALRQRASAEKGLSFDVAFNAHDSGINRSAAGYSAPKEMPPFEYEAGAKGSVVWFKGNYGGAMPFGAVGRVVAKDGDISVVDSGLKITNCSESILLVLIFAGKEPDDAIRAAETELENLPADYEALFERHHAKHRRLFLSMELNIAEPGVESNEELLLRAYDGNVPSSLVQTMFDYGRHLLICSSGKDGWPANLQGVWNGDYNPAWSSDIHNDENIQMNYWQALPGNLPELAGAYFSYFERFLDQYRENAKLIYGCRGILLPIAQSTHGKMYPNVWVNWISGAGWIAQLFYDYYLFTGDLDFLKEHAVPWLKETALFYEDFLIEGDAGRYEFIPSMSPENVPSRNDASLITINATMDIAVCREVLANLCSGCDKLGIEASNVGKWREMIEKLPPYEVNEDGAIREWLHPLFPDNYHHRHQSHIYGLFPGIEITLESDPAMYEACKIAVEKRLVIGLASQTGWSMAHMANIFARLGEGNRALECIEILTRSSTGPNLFTYHNDWRSMGLSLGNWGSVPPFQIDANFGTTAAVLEMLVFSTPGMIKLLPALPDAWAKGSAKGIACRGGITTDITWDTEVGSVGARLTSSEDQEVLVAFPAGVEKAQSTGCALSPSDRGDRYRVVDLRAGSPAQLDLNFNE